MTTPVLFIRQAYDELRQVVWPTRKEIFRLTSIVIIICIIMGLYVGGLDWVFTQAIQLLLK